VERATLTGIRQASEIVKRETLETRVAARKSAFTGALSALQASIGSGFLE
jgi:hypothetical protein